MYVRGKTDTFPSFLALEPQHGGSDACLGAFMFSTRNNRKKMKYQKQLSESSDGYLTRPRRRFITLTLATDVGLDHGFVLWHSDFNDMLLMIGISFSDIKIKAWRTPAFALQHVGISFVLFSAVLLVELQVWMHQRRF